MKRDATPPPAHDDSLRRLLDTEQAIEERLAAAKREAAQLVDAARARAADAEAAADASIVRELAAWVTAQVVAR